MLDMVDCEGNRGLSYTHYMAKDDGAMYIMNSEQGPVHSMRLDR